MNRALRRRGLTDPPPYYDALVQVVLVGVQGKIDDSGGMGGAWVGALPVLLAKWLVYQPRMTQTEPILPL